MNRRNLLAVLAALPAALVARVKAKRAPLYCTKVDHEKREMTFDTEPPRTRVSRDGGDGVVKVTTW